MHRRKVRPAEFHPRRLRRVGLEGVVVGMLGAVDRPVVVVQATQAASGSYTVGTATTSFNVTQP